jgi:4-alpha-glucanotransferase
MLRITAQESRRHRCIVIGEDLGTVPDGFRAELAQWGIWSYQVMLFERDAAGEFHPPQHYSERALVTFATHDLPTFAGWAVGRDLETKRALSLDPGETNDERDSAIGALRRATAAHAIGAPGFPSIVAYLAATPARLLVIGLEDALGLTEQPNIPGTIDQHPNWRRKYPLDLDAMFDAEGLAAIARIASANGRSVRQGPRIKRQKR